MKITSKALLYLWASSAKVVLAITDEKSIVLENVSMDVRIFGTEKWFSSFWLIFLR